MCLCLASSISGCATSPERVMVTIPASLLQDCPVPEWEGTTYRHVAELSERRRAALLNCNAQLGEARAYQERLKSSITR